MSAGLWWAATPIAQWPDGGDVESGEVKRIAEDFALEADPAGEK